MTRTKILSALLAGSMAFSVLSAFTVSAEDNVFKTREDFATDEEYYNYMANLPGVYLKTKLNEFFDSNTNAQELIANGLIKPKYLEMTLPKDAPLYRGETTYELSAEEYYKLPREQALGSVYNIIRFWQISEGLSDEELEEDLSDMLKKANRKKEVIYWETLVAQNEKFKELYGTPKKEDVNFDNAITVDDALVILNNVVGIEKFNQDKIKMSDVDQDGKITTNDALAILKIVVGLT